MNDMNARSFRNAILLLGLAAGGALVGCELIVDFDRTKIPIEDAGATTDGTTPPPAGDGASDAPADAPNDAPQDAGNDASDAADADAGD